MDLTTPFLTPRPANVHFLQVALDYGTIKTVLRGASIPFVNLEIQYSRNTNIGILELTTLLLVDIYNEFSIVL